MKKILSLMIVGIMLLSICGCSKKESNDFVGEIGGTTKQQTQTDDGKTDLSAFGNTSIDTSNQQESEQQVSNNTSTENTDSNTNTAASTDVEKDTKPEIVEPVSYYDPEVVKELEAELQERVDSMNDGLIKVENADGTTTVKDKGNHVYTEKELQDITETDRVIRELQDSEAYNKASIDDKVKLVEDLLNKLAKDGTADRKYPLIRAESIVFIDQSGDNETEYVFEFIHTSGMYATVLIEDK